MTVQLSPTMEAIIEKNLSPSEKCYFFLKEGILTGYFKRGQRIVERDLINLLHISRTPLREALRKLEKETLVEHKQNKGCTVVGFSGQDILEIYELRRVLECFMIREVARSAQREELLALRDEVVLKKDCTGEGGNDWNFHTRMLRLTRHGWLKTVLGQLEEYIERFHVVSFLRHGRKGQAYYEHLAIVDALLDDDVKKAERLLKKHLDKSYEAFKTIFSLV